MPDFPIRKIAVLSEEILHDGGPAARRAAPARGRAGAGEEPVRRPLRRADLQRAMEDLKPLGALLTERLIEALGGDVTVDRRLRQGRDRRHGRRDSSTARCGTCRAATRCASGSARRKAIVPSAMKVGGFGASSTCRSATPTPPMCAAISTRWTVGDPDGPRPDEIVFVLAMSCGPRIHSRMGGLEAWPGQGRGRAAVTRRGRSRLQAGRRGAAKASYRLQEQIGFILRKAHQRHVAIFAAQHRRPDAAAVRGARASCADVGETSQNQLGS